MQGLQEEYTALSESMEKNREKYRNSAILLTEYLDYLLEKNLHVITGENEERDIDLDVEKIKEYNKIEDIPE